MVTFCRLLLDKDEELASVKIGGCTGDGVGGFITVVPNSLITGFKVPKIQERYSHVMAIIINRLP